VAPPLTATKNEPVIFYADVAEQPSEKTNGYPPMAQMFADREIPSPICGHRRNLWMTFLRLRLPVAVSALSLIRENFSVCEELSH
jgi:hypothetical protein